MNNFLKKAAANNSNNTAGGNTPAPKKLGGLGLGKKPLGAKLGGAKPEGQETTAKAEIASKLQPNKDKVVEEATKPAVETKEVPTTPATAPAEKPLSKMEQAKLKMAQAKAKKDAEAKPLEAKTENEFIVKDKVAEEVEKVEETQTTPATEEKTEAKEAPAKKATTKKSTAKKSETAPKAEPVVPVQIEITNTEVDFATAIQDIRSGFVDEKWEAQKLELETKLQDIMLSPDMNAAGIMAVESALWQLRDSVWKAFAETKTLFESLTCKDTGTIDRVRNLNLRGANAEERKFNATMALIKYVSPNGNRINLLELQDETRRRYNFLKQFMDSIDYKCGVCITALGAIKQGK